MHCILHEHELHSSESYVYFALLKLLKRANLLGLGRVGSTPPPLIYFSTTPLCVAHVRPVAADVTRNVVCVSVCWTQLMYTMRKGLNRSRCRLAYYILTYRWGRYQTREGAIVGVFRPIEKLWESAAVYAAKGSFSP